MKNKSVIVLVMIIASLLLTFMYRSAENSEENMSSVLDESLQDTTEMNKSLTQSNDEVLADELNKLKVKSGKIKISKATKDKLIKIRQQALTLKNCQLTNTCPIDQTDSRASSLLLGKKIAEQLAEYRKISEENDYFDDDSFKLVQEFLDSKDGFVQEEAIHLMSMQRPSEELARQLINVLADSYDAKIFNQSLIELQRYPNLSSEVQTLLSETLVTGSFYTAQEVATNILPFLSGSNIQHYTNIANTLPQNSIRARALHSNIREFQLRSSGG